MDWLHHSQLSNGLIKAIYYSSQYSYPLTLSEIVYWQVGSRYTSTQAAKVLRKYIHQKKIYLSHGFYYLPSHSSDVKTRLSRQKPSSLKYVLATTTAKRLSYIPTIEAIFLTGSLSMQNSPKHDDIDFMIVTTPHSLWITRFLVILILSITGRRRSSSLPEHSSPRVSNKICDNLYLDTNNLRIRTHNLYLAHEIIQAKPLFDKHGTHHHFLQVNSWTNKLLPIAYPHLLKSSPPLAPRKLNTFTNFTLSILNRIFFVFQYTYMRPKMTTEKVGLGYAFFHPHPKSHF